MNNKFIQQCLWAYRQYFKSQGKLFLLILFVLFVGFAWLHISHPFLLASVFTIVDAFPLFGSGILFLPWIIFCLIQGQMVFAFKLFLVWGLNFILRQVMENYFLGKDFAIPFYLPIFLAILCSLVFNMFAWLVLPLLLPLVAVAYHYFRKDKSI